MNQCVPSWDVDENPLSPKLNPRSHHSKSSNSFTIHVPTLDYEVAELTWENGQLAMHGLGLPRVPSGKSSKATSYSSTKYTWEKPRAGGTLESIVDQATSHPQPKSAVGGGCGGGDEFVPWLAVPVSSATAAASASLNMEAAAAAAAAAAAVVPSNSAKSTGQEHHRTRVVGSSTRVESCSGVPDVNLQQSHTAGAANDWSSRGCDHSVSNSATWGNNRDSRQVTRDTCDREFGTVGFTSTSSGSPENTTSSAKQWTNKADDHDSVCHDRRPPVESSEEKEKKKGKSSISTKRSRAAAIHNQSERKRRDKINQRMKTLQKLIPNSSKTDKASMLDEVIEYLKQLQAQVQMMSRVHMSTMMLPMAMQQQLQMSMMAAATPMGMAGMGMAGMGMMDLNTLAGRPPNIPGMHPHHHLLHPGAFIPAITPWDANAGDPLSAVFLACQSQPITMDAYSRLASMYQQFQHQPGPSSKN